MVDRQVAAGKRHGVGLEVDGTVIVWGDNGFNQLDMPVGLSSVEAIVAGDYHSLALKSDATVEAWGYGDQGQTTVPAGLANVTEIAAGAFHSLALKSDGSVVVWGYDSHGQSTLPAGLPTVNSIGAGGYHCLVVLSDNTVQAWGRDDYGQATVPAGLTSVVAVAGGDYHSLALKSDGTVVAWGQNTYNQAAVPAGLSNVAAIAAAGNHSLALKSDGSLVAWGSNSGGPTSIPAGLGTVVSISSGYQHNLVLLADYTATAWGNNDYGQTDIPAQFQSPPPSTQTYVSLPITIEVVTGKVSLPLLMDVSTPTALSLPISVSVYDHTSLPGNSGSISGGSFSVRVTVAGADYTSQLIGEILVDAEEDAARVATFDLKLPAGSFHPDDWINEPVSIDYREGVVSYPIFNGIVDLPELSLDAHTVRISCTDDLQRRFENQPRAVIEALFDETDAVWSEAVFGEYEDSAQFAEDMLSTIPASANLDRSGMLVIAPWHNESFDFLFADSEVFPESISVEWASRKELVTRVDIECGYSYQYFRERRHTYSWEYPRSFGEYLEENSSLPTTVMVEQAAEVDGWSVFGKVVYERLPESGEYDLPGGGSTNWSISDDVRLSLATAADFTIRKRWVQDVRENYAVTVRSKSNIDRFGTLVETFSANLDTAIDEAGFEEFESDPGVAQTTVGNDIAWSTFEADARNDMLQTAVAHAHVMILESMRQNSASFRTLLQPELELYHYARLSSDKVTAQGKIRRFRHVIDLNEGAALTDIELAVFRAENGVGVPLNLQGLDYVEDPADGFTTLYTILQDFTGLVPVPPEEYEGYVGNYISQLNNVPNPFEERFGFKTPEISAVSRDPVEYAEETTVEIETVNDDLSVTL